VRVFIDADGCFSGAFVDLSSKDVCVSSLADRREAGISIGFLWRKVRDQKAKRLADLDAFPYVASRQIESLMCRKAREMVFSDWPSADIDESGDDKEPDWSKPTENSYFYSEAQCIRDDESDFKRLYSLNRGFLKFLADSSRIRCKDVGFSGDLCRALNIVRSHLFTKEFEELKEISSQLSQISTESTRRDALRARFNAKLSTLLQGKYFVAWQRIEPCLFNVEAEISDAEKQYVASHRGNIPLFPRKYSQKDIDDAKACEASIRFDAF
jgi:hypothetical protein